MGIFKAFWQEAIAAFRAERQGGSAAEASRRHEQELRAELAQLIEDAKDERKAAGLWKRMQKAKTPAEESAARADLVNYVLRGHEDEPRVPKEDRPTMTDDIRPVPGPNLDMEELERLSLRILHAGDREVVSADITKTLADAALTIAKLARDLSHALQHLKGTLARADAAEATIAKLEVRVMELEERLRGRA